MSPASKPTAGASPSGRPAETIPAACARPARRRLAVVLFGVAVFLFWTALYIYVPTLPVYAQQRGASLGLVGMIVASYGLTQLILRIPLGLASDRWGRRQPFVLAGFAITVVSCLALAWAPSPGWLLLGRSLAGVSASSWVAATVLFASYFDPKETVRASSIVTFVAAGAQLVGMAAGGHLADTAGWLAPFYAGAAIAALGALLMAAVADDKATRRNGSPWATFRRVGTRPLLLAASGIAAVGQCLNQGTTYGFVPVYAADALGMSRTALGLLGTITQVGYMAGTLGAGVLLQRVSPRVKLVTGLVLIGLMTAAVPLSPSFPVLAAGRLFFGLGYGMIYPVAMGLSISGVPGEERASAMGIFQALYAIGMFAGPAALGWLAEGLGLPAMFWLTSLLPLAVAGGALLLPRAAAVRKGQATG